MNVKELKELLSGYGDNVKVLLSIDEEGNAFNELSDQNPLEKKNGKGKITSIVLFPDA
jgi:hypothetical protein